MMARPRQPIDLLLVKGNKNLTKAEIDDRKAKEVKAPSTNIEPPTYLPDELKTEFKRLAKDLVEIEIMSNLDCESLARFIVSEHQYQKVTQQLLKLKSFGKRYMELLAIQDKLFKMCRSAANDLGLTISSRCKLVVPKSKEDDTPKTDAQKRFGDRV